MPKIVRYEFLGSPILFWVMCVTVVGMPFAVLYLVNGTLRIEEEMEDPQAFVEAYRAGRLRRR